jgi:hypothetical protein
VVKFFVFLIKKEQKKKKKMLRNSWKCFFFIAKEIFFCSIFIFFCNFFDQNLMPIVFLGGVLFFFEEGHLWRRKK